MITDKPVLDHYDVVVVGSGPAGITTALKLAEQTSAKIAIVESGLLEAHKKIQQLAQVELSGELQHDYFPMHTQRCFGGSSTIWGGFCATMEKRAFAAQGWPIQYRELERWYPHAARILELPRRAHERASVPLAGTSDLVYRPFYLSPPVRFNQKYHQVIDQHPDIHLILNKTCTRLLNQGADVDGVELADSLNPNVPLEKLVATRYVLACGGVGNPRLLQLSGMATEMPVGVGLMEHPHLYGVGKVYLDRNRIEEVIEKKARVVHALQMSDSYCIENDIQSFSVDFNLEQFTETPLLGRTETALLTPVSVRAEMKAYPHNRVDLSQQKDYLGQPKSKVDFQFHCEETAYKTWEYFSRALLQSGMGRPSTLAPELKPDGGGHLLGTTPMGSSAKDSVVDHNCRVHGSNNLYVAGSSIFPAGGASNPTFTIVAFSLRLGEHLAGVIEASRNYFQNPHQRRQTRIVSTSAQNTE